LKKRNNFKMFKFWIIILYSSQLIYGESVGALNTLNVSNSKILQYANGFIGCTYGYGRKSHQKIDCSGFVQEVFGHYGIILPRRVSEQSRIGKRISFQNIREGDLLFFYRTQKSIPSHVAIYAGEGRIIHASYLAKKVHIDSINKAFYQQHFLFAKRLTTEIAKQKTSALKLKTQIILTGAIEHIPKPLLFPEKQFRNYQIFDGREVILSDEGKEFLRKWVQLFKLRGLKSVSINVYTDNIPPKIMQERFPTNLTLSEARAKIIAEFLMTQGINSDDIKAYGMGETNPIASNETKEGQSKNRRIEFIF